MRRRLLGANNGQVVQSLNNLGLDESGLRRTSAAALAHFRQAFELSLKVVPLDRGRRRLVSRQRRHGGMGGPRHPEQLSVTKRGWPFAARFFPRTIWISLSASTAWEPPKRSRLPVGPEELEEELATVCRRTIRIFAELSTWGTSPFVWTI